MMLDVISSNNISALWASHSCRSMDWAKVAYGSFLNTLDPTLARQYRQHADEVTVTVFGKIGAGKTALILTLLGIAPKYFKLATQVLHGVHPRDGGAEVAMKFSRSVDNHWYLVVDGRSERFVNQQSIETRITAICSELEISGLHPKDPIEIRLPGNFFAANAKIEQSVNVIDLPGDNSSNKLDQTHIYSIAENYIQNVDLVLLVGDTDDLSFIDPIRMRFPALSDWCFSPSRFRIITISKARTAWYREELAHQDSIDQRALRQQALAELVDAEGIVIPESALNLCLYYPLGLDLNESALNAAALEFQPQAKLMTTQLLSELKRDIQFSATVRRRLRHAAQVHIVANGHKRARQMEYEAQIRNISSDSLELEQKTHILKAAAAWTRLDSGRLPSADQVRHYQSRLRASITGSGNWANEDSAAIKSRIKELLRLLHDCVDDLMRTAACCDPANLVGLSLRNHIPAIDRIRDKWLEPQLLSLKQRLESYFDPTRQVSAPVPTSLNGDLSDLRNLSTLGVEALHVALRFNWESVITALDRDGNQKRKKAVNRINIGKDDAAGKFTGLSSFPIYLKDMQQQLEDNSIRLERDEANGRCFLALLSDAFELQAREIRAGLAGNISSTAKLVLLLALRQLDDEKVQLLSPATNFKELNQ